MPSLDVLYEDNHVLAVVKPAGLTTMGALPGVETLLDRARAYVKHKYHKPGNVYLGCVSRLDGPVSGVVLIARTSKAADRLSAQFRDREVSKVYWAVVSGTLHPSAGSLTNWLAPDERHRKMHVVGPDHPEGKEARLSYRLLQTVPGGSLVEVQLETGRKHQIRLQLATHGNPVVGDRKYGSSAKFPAGIALHAREVTFAHPVRDEAIRLEAPVPASWRQFGIV